MFERHIASENEAASDLAYEAAVRAIESSSVKYKDIDQIMLHFKAIPSLQLPAFCKEIGVERYSLL